MVYLYTCTFLEVWSGNLNLRNNARTRSTYQIDRNKHVNFSGMKQRDHSFIHWAFWPTWEDLALRNWLINYPNVSHQRWKTLGSRLASEKKTGSRTRLTSAWFLTSFSSWVCEKMCTERRKHTSIPLKPRLVSTHFLKVGLSTSKAEAATTTTKLCVCVLSWTTRSENGKLGF